jgi:hypothetical protein
MARLANQVNNPKMLLQFRRFHEEWSNTIHSENLKKNGRKPPVHVGINLLTIDHKVVEWNPALPDERLYMPSQVQVELRTIAQCDEVLRGIECVEQGHMPNYSHNGIAWDVFFDIGGVDFTYSLMDGAPGGRVGLKIYGLVLKAWREFLLNDGCEEELFCLPDGL